MHMNARATVVLENLLYDVILEIEDVFWSSLHTSWYQNAMDYLWINKYCVLYFEGLQLIYKAFEMFDELR